MDHLSVTCWNPQQAHAELGSKLWPWVKSMTLAGHKLQVTARKATRSVEQNSRLWAMLGEVSKSVDWYGQKLSPEDWKHIFTASLKKTRAVPGIDGGFVVLGLSTSKMTKGEMSELMELIEAFASERGLVLKESEFGTENY
jgi:hypothetical protein